MKNTLVDEPIELSDEVRNSASINAAIELSVVIPTFNENKNVAEVVNRVNSCLKGVAWEIIFVDDDSPDGTADCVRQMARINHRVRVIHRLRRRGLSSACVEGMLASSAPYVAVMDADLQHDETLLSKMLDVIRQGGTDIVVGSRYIYGGGIGKWKASRARASLLAARLSRFILKADLGDPMSGFFMMTHEAMLKTVRGLSEIGFKILVDLFASSPEPLRFREVPYEFRERHAGESKLDSAVAWEYVMLLLDKLIGHIVPIRFITFSLIGGLGVFLHLFVLTIFYQGMTTNFILGQSVATVVAMTSNFLLNNILTYRDMRLRGWGLLHGWISFCLACSVGAVANIGIATYLFEMDTFWVLSALAGVMIGAVWNYAVTAVYTWRMPRKA